MDVRDRYRGALLGLAAGDALGTTLEFKLPGSFTPIDDIVGGGPFNLPPGAWTDDTSMALCLADSLTTKKGFDPLDQMQRYVRWYRQGYLSSTGRCFDIGNTTRAALERFEHTRDPYSGPTDPQMAGNGSLMRLAPVPLYCARQPRIAIERAAESSRTTHGAPAAIDCCRYMAALIVGALRGASKDQLLASRYEPEPDVWRNVPLLPRTTEIAAGSYKQRNPPEIRGTGFVVQSLEAALWAFYQTDNFRDGALRAVNLGEDADTTGAIYGQLAGAFYGEQAIPETWRARLVMRELITSLADKLAAQSV
jgi:ADP-ribosylglycohydrolase